MKNVHPVSAAVYFFSVLIIAMFSINPVFQALALSGAILFCLFVCKKTKSDIFFYSVMFVLIAITNPLFSHNGVTPLFFLNGNPVTKESFLYGIDIAVALIAVMLWFKAYNEIFTEDKLLYLFGRILPETALILSMALRFIPLFKQKMHRVDEAQKAMGLYSSKSFVDRIHGRLRVFSAMIAWSLENSVDTAISMKMRGYGLKGRTHFALFRFTKSDGAVLIISLALFAFALLGQNNITFAFYPRITALNINAYTVSVYVCYGILSLMPAFIEVRERMFWKYCVLKI